VLDDLVEIEDGNDRGMRVHLDRLAYGSGRLDLGAMNEALVFETIDQFLAAHGTVWAETFTTGGVCARAVPRKNRPYFGLCGPAASLVWNHQRRVYRYDGRFFANVGKHELDHVFIPPQQACTNEPSPRVIAFDNGGAGKITSRPCKVYSNGQNY
jgi:hypothetical protein